MENGPKTELEMLREEVEKLKMLVGKGKGQKPKPKSAKAGKRGKGHKSKPKTASKSGGGKGQKPSPKSAKGTGRGDQKKSKSKSKFKALNDGERSGEVVYVSGKGEYPTLVLKLDREIASQDYVLFNSFWDKSTKYKKGDTLTGIVKFRFARPVKIGKFTYNMFVTNN